MTRWNSDTGFLYSPKYIALIARVREVATILYSLYEITKLPGPVALCAIDAHVEGLIPQHVHFCQLR